MGRHVYVHSGSYYFVFDIDLEQRRDDYNYIQLKLFHYNSLLSRVMVAFL
ncbi:hypothetical protein LguiA_027108 [Lonicera macranthoides]